MTHADLARALLLCALLLLLASPAFSAEGEPAPAAAEAAEAEAEPEKVEETPMQRGQRKLSELNKATEAIEALIDASKGAIGEQQDLLRIQAMELVEDLQELLHLMTKNSKNFLLPELELLKLELELHLRTKSLTSFLQRLLVLHPFSKTKSAHLLLELLDHEDELQFSVCQLP